MGILDLMLGRTGPGEQGVEGQSYKLPKATHAFVYPVAVRRSELEAFEELLAADADAPAFDADPDELQSAVDDLVGEAAVDLEALTASRDAARDRTATLLEGWHAQLTTDVGVVYVTEDARSTVRAYLAGVKRRHDDPDDEFELPASADDVMAFLGRMTAVSDDQYRAVVHTDLLPAN